jgi:hypothetical protein
MVAVGLGFGIVAIKSLNTPSPIPTVSPPNSPDDLFGNNAPRGFRQGTRSFGFRAEKTELRPQKKMMQEQEK